MGSRARSGGRSLGTQGVLVRRPEELTAAWAQRVIDAGPLRARITGAKILAVDVGTTSRVQLAVEHDAPEALPQRWFVKVPSASWRARAITALPRLPETEVRFYTEVASEVPVRRPAALAAVSRLGRGFTLVLEDVAGTGATPGRPGDLLSAEQAGAVVDVLARLHASHWEAPDLDRRLGWLAGPVRRLEDRLGSALAVPLMRHGLRRAGEAVPARLHGPALRYARRRRRAMRVLAEGPRTLVHHDCHPGNLYWSGAAPGLLDWQMVRIGEGLGDVAYLLATALAPETRRAAQDGLLARYRRALVAAGTPPLDPACLARRYRAHTSYAFEAMVATLAVGGLMADAVATELVRRTAQAVDDLDAFEAIEEEAAGSRG
jgi:aminoglycoside phosphotransferase (APT) family kinase protein